MSDNETTKLYVEADVNRVTSMLRKHLTSVYEVARSRGQQISLETFSVVGIFEIRFDDRDGVGEECLMFSESSKPYIQEGILYSALRELDVRMKETIDYDEEEDEVEDDDITDA